MAKKSNPTVGNSNRSNMKTKDKKKKTKKNKSGPDAIAMKHKAPKPNPFESIWSRRKFDILGKKRSGEQLRIGLARSLAIQKRKKTLLKEYEQSGKSSVFVDKRLAEQIDELAESDKAILRAQHQQMRQLKNKNSKFNLPVGEEDEYDRQHIPSLAEIDDFEDEVAPEDEDYAEAADPENMFVGRERFATLLLMRLTETVILWLSEDQSFWDDIEEGPRPLGPLGLQQFCLDMKFVSCFASHGRYLSRNLNRIVNEIISKAIAAFAATGMDPYSILPDDDWFIDACQDAMERLSGNAKVANGDRDLNSPTASVSAQSMSSVRSHGSS